MVVGIWAKEKGALRALLRFLPTCNLRYFNQFDLAVLPAVQYLDLTLGIAEDEDLAIAELALLHRFFHGHGTHGDGVIRLHQMGFGGAGNGWKLVHDHRYCRSRVGS